MSAMPARDIQELVKKLKESPAMQSLEVASEISARVDALKLRRSGVLETLHKHQEQLEQIAADVKRLLDSR